jgi:hypothetical protein
MATSPVPVPANSTINLPGQTGGAVPMNTGNTSAIPSTTSMLAPAGPGGTANVPVAGTGTGQLASNTASSAVGSQLQDIYGATGGAINNLLNSETSGTANSTANAIITANQPNVATQQANLNTNLAAAGISPSSSVSAIENANFNSGVAQQDASLLAQTNMEEQQMQQNLLLGIAPAAQQQQTDSSGWGIFNNVMQGLGDIGGAVTSAIGAASGIPTQSSGHPVETANAAYAQDMASGGISTLDQFYTGGL